MAENLDIHNYDLMLGAYMKKIRESGKINEKNRELRIELLDQLFPGEEDKVKRILTAKKSKK